MEKSKETEDKITKIVEEVEKLGVNKIPETNEKETKRDNPSKKENPTRPSVIVTNKTQVSNDQHVMENNKYYNNYQCYTCGSSFSQENDLVSHVDRSHVTDIRKICDKCERRFNSNRDLKQHNLTAHVNLHGIWQNTQNYKGENHNPKYRHETETQLKWCRFCRKAFRSYNDLVEHSQREQNYQRRGMSSSTNRFSDNRSIKAHFQTRRDDSWQIPLYNRFDAFNAPKNA